MRLETANRAFATLVGIALAVVIASVLVACGVLGVLGYGLLIGTTGIAALIGSAFFVALVVAGGVAGIWSLRSQLRATRDLSRRIEGITLPVSGSVEHAARRAGLDDRVVLVDADEPFAFAYGLRQPRVVVSRGLASAPSEELDVVLAHERYHVRNLDPLKVLLTRTLSASFFYFPVLGVLHRRYVAGRELAADRVAIVAHGRRPLVSALHRVIAGPTWSELRAAAAMGDPGALLEARVMQLETGQEPMLAKMRWHVVAVTALLASVLVWASVTAMIEMSRLMPTMMSR